MTQFIQPFDPVLRQNIVRLAEAYVRLEQISLSRASRRVYGDAVFLGRMVDGTGNLTVRIYDKVVAAFFRLWPENGMWPDLVDPTHFPEESTPDVQSSKKVSTKKGGKSRKAKNGSARKKASGNGEEGRRQAR